MVKSYGREVAKMTVAMIVVFADRLKKSICQIKRVDRTPLAPNSPRLSAGRRGPCRGRCKLAAFYQVGNKFRDDRRNMRIPLKGDMRSTTPKRVHSRADKVRSQMESVGGLIRKTDKPYQLPMLLIWTPSQWGVHSLSREFDACTEYPMARFQLLFIRIDREDPSRGSSVGPMMDWSESSSVSDS